MVVGFDGDMDLLVKAFPKLRLRDATNTTTHESQQHLVKQKTGRPCEAKKVAIEPTLISSPSQFPRPVRLQVGVTFVMPTLTSLQPP